MASKTIQAAALPRRSRRQANKQWIGVLFVLPSLLFVVAFFLLPLLMTAWMSLHDWPLLGKHSFIGVGNYLRMLHDKTFWSSLRFTSLYTLAVTPFLFLLGFGMALLARVPSRITGVFRTSVFLPAVLGLSTASLLFLWLLNDQVGVLNAGLVGLGFLKQPFVWQLNLSTSLLVVVAVITWKAAGNTMLFLLIGMQAIPAELYEAATVDGASAWQRLRFITLPLLRRTFALTLVLSVTGSYLAFDQFYVMTNGGPNNQTITSVYYLYNTAFGYYRLGYASALSLVLLVILGLLSVLQLRLLRDDTTV
ncbi:carbohydrate ABC transporter permease [Deinococcus sp.]|uniref:carbohydrate ABC transporter permease n=1 Tax=Deinococcus sp. TaxID=47478 RepID=UPI003B5AB3A0